VVFYQEWVPSFNPLKPHRLLIPFWISLQFLPQDFTEMAYQVASRVDRVLVNDTNTDKKAAPRFCVGIDLSLGWMSIVAIPNLQCEDAIVYIEYEAVKNIRCPRCWDLMHYEINCPTLWSSSNGPSPGHGNTPSLQEHRPPPTSSQPLLLKMPPQCQYGYRNRSYAPRRPTNTPKRWQRTQARTDNQGYTLV
jgi:hypothetical protein